MTVRKYFIQSFIRINQIKIMDYFLEKIPLMAVSRSVKPKELLIVCDNCFAEINNLAYVQCYGCISDLCLLCFFNQTETPTHNKYHEYRIISKMDVDIYGNGWSLFEEVLLIEGLETCGIGNWIEISHYIGNNKDVENHFI